ncbi:hypothetical protein BDA99DRAFT_437934 [Phascolomyces articulosus]|uniref:Uncharacterized protein n=1 Tax=Phascolomyces articulosus TaxID=60185 RepID=A0AAD5PDX7_9FUNG|nr:hypothetical protein BDA99DRAFT_437934 [Phascolomyces articulosus]
MPEGWNASNAHPIVQKIRQNPQVMEHLVEFTLLLQKKGIDVTGKQPGFTDMMKIMNDPEIKEVVKNLAQEMQSAGIQLDMQSIGEIQKSLESFQPSSTTTTTTSQNKNEQDQKQEEEDQGVVNKMKGFFKK